MKKIGRYCWQRVPCSPRPTKKKRAAKKRATKMGAKKRSAKKKRAGVGTTAPGTVIPRRALTRAEFARAVELATLNAPPWHGKSDKSLLRDVYAAAERKGSGLSLRGMAFDDFKERLRAERFPLEAIDLVDILTPRQRAENDFFGRGPHAIRKGVRLA